jgi:carbon starvation protein
VSLPLLAAIVLVGLALGYHFYGGFIARQYGLDPHRKTPAHEQADGVDFVPTRPFYLFGQHFSAIAAAGPIVGPILACQVYGWLPSILWIGIGVIFIGAVHDVSALVASVRHDARSIAEVVRRNLGKEAWIAILAFIWLALIYVLVAFADLTAQTFASRTDPELAKLGLEYNQGGAVALAAIVYLSLAVIMGVVDRWLKPPLWLETAIFVPATVAAIWLGTEYSTVILLDWKVWVVLIMAYCFVASLVPMWLLLQPRGYLGGFVLYGTLIIGTIGIFSGRFDIAQPAFKGWGSADGNSLLFPFLFVTIACGACSGFHGLVCSGTTSKQIDREPHCHPIGYGAMLLEAFVALIALATVMTVAPGTGGTPGEMYARGLGGFLSLLIGENNMHIAVTFGAMALSTFVFDTIDSGTRLGRYVLQELFGATGRIGAVIATLATVVTPLVFLLAGGRNSFRAFWALFGTANQLLAGLTLLGITVWLHKLGKRPWWTFVPMLLVLAVTLTALVFQARALLDGKTTTAQINGAVAVILGVLAATLIAYALRAVSKRHAGPDQQVGHAG